MAQRVRVLGVTAAAVAMAGLALTGCGKKAAKAAVATTTSAAVAAPGASTTSTVAKRTTSSVQGAVPLPDGVKGDFGNTVAIAVPKAGAPVVAYVWGDSTGDSDTTRGDDELFTATYDPAKAAWGAPVLQTKGANLTGRFGTNIALAADPATGTVGLAWVDDPDGDASKGIQLALSTDGGATWGKGARAAAADGATRPALGIGGGTITLAFATAGVQVATAKVSASPTFTIVGAPDLGPEHPATMPPAVAVDPSGAATVLYYLDPDTGYNRVLAAWKPGSATPVKVLDSNGKQNDDALAALAFKGTTAIAMSSLVRSGGEDLPIASYATSTDGGATWSPAKPVPTKGASGPFSLSLAAGKGETVLAYVPNSSNGTADCASPSLSASTDLSGWVTCDPFNGAMDGVTSGHFPGAAVGPDGADYVAFNNTATDAKLPAGILVWTDGGMPLVKKDAAAP